MKKLRGNKAVLQMNHFDRLPDELLVLIINRIHDLKSLCQCTIAYKRFASKINHIQSVTVRLPGIDVESLAEESNPCRLFCKIIEFDEQEIMQLFERPSVHLKKLRFLKFLEKFTQLESVTLNFDCPRTTCTTSFLKWTLKFLQNGTLNWGVMVEGVVSLLPTSIFNESDQDEDEELEEHPNQVDVFDFLQSHGGENALLFPLMCCCEWLVVVSSVIKRLHSIRKLKCMDVENHGSFELTDEKLAEWRTSLLNDQHSRNTKPPVVSIGWVPDLRLPISGVRMKGVFCVFMDFRPELKLANGEAEFDIFKNLKYNDDGEKVMGEAVKEILDKHLHMIKWSYVTLFHDCCGTNTSNPSDSNNP